MLTHRRGRPIVCHSRLWLEPLEARELLAVLSPGDPVVAGTPTTFSGVGGTITSGGALNALNAFQAAIGGVNNGNTAQPLLGGSRRINWDGVALDGTNPGSVVISPGKTVGIPQDSFQTRGVFFETIYAVSGDGFASVNPSTAGKFPAFSTHNTFAMFNDNTIDFSFVLPSPANTTPAPAATRGFGAIFVNVRTPNTSSIELFHGAQLLGTFFAPTSNTAGDPEFLGVLYNNPIVTNVTLTLGTDSLFNFNGSTTTASNTDNPPTHNLVVTDDFLYPEPVQLPNAPPVIDGGQGVLNTRPLFNATPDVPFTGTVATFSSNDASATAAQFFAVIHWGDGHSTNGTVTADGKGGFAVAGTNIYHDPGLYSLSVEVQSFTADKVTVVNTASVGTPNQLFLAQLYEDLLQRPLDAIGLVGWGNLLDQGVSRQTVVGDIEQSAEYLGVEVQGLFQHYLHRAAEPAAVAAFSALLANGTILEQVAADLAGSAEYFQRRGGGTNPGLATVMFQDILGRTPDAATVNAIATELNSTPAVQVALTLLATQEYRQHAVDLLFRDGLRRGAELSAQTGLAAAYNSGFVNGLDPFRQINAVVLGSPEYLADVQAQLVLLPPIALDFLAPNVG
jgi:hypothetical protein